MSNNENRDKLMHTYLFDRCLTPQSWISHLFDSGHYWTLGKLGRALGKPTATRWLLEAFPRTAANL